MPQPTTCLLEDLPGRIVLGIDDTADRVDGHQELALLHAHYDGRCFLPIHVYEALTVKPMAVILRAGTTPMGPKWPAPRRPPHPVPSGRP